MKWRTASLRECATFSSGGTPNKGSAAYWAGDIPWVSSGEMTKQFLDDTSLHISEAGAEAGSRLVPPGTIFAVVRGMSLATEFRVSFATRRMAFNQDLKALTAKPGVDPRFLFAALRSHASLIRDLATEAGHGTKKLDMERLQSFQIKIPDLETQRRVADVVNAYDELIENNQRRIKLLEEAARRLYREWFVALRFPGHERGTVVGGVPQGWERGTVGDALQLQRGFDLPSAERKAGRIPIVASTGIAGYHNESRVQGPGVVTGRSGTLGVVHFVHEDFWPLNTSLWVKEFRRVTPLCAYFLLSELGLAQFNSGASVPTLDRNVVHPLPVLIPPASVQREFDRLANPLFEQRHALEKAANAARQARDAILPRLMSGALAV